MISSLKLGSYLMNSTISKAMHFSLRSLNNLKSLLDRQNWQWQKSLKILSDSWVMILSIARKICLETQIRKVKEERKRLKIWLTKLQEIKSHNRPISNKANKKVILGLTVKTKLKKKTKSLSKWLGDKLKLNSRW